MAATAPSGAATLVGRLQTRERQAWEELYREFEPRLHRFAYRLTGNRHDAADLVQETFVRALPRLDKLDPENVNISAYLFTTAKNVFLRQAERSARQQPVDEVPEPTGERPIEDEPERLLQLHRQQEEVRLANARLAPRQRLVLALRELEDRSYAQIGELVGLNENAVAQLISRARENLRHELRLIQVDGSKLAAECQALLPQLSAYLDGQLKEPARTHALEHLGRCDDCQAALADMEEARRRYRTLLPILSGGDELKGRIERALDQHGYWTRRRFRKLPKRGRTIAGAAGVVGALAGLALVSVALAHHHSRHPVPLAAARVTARTTVHHVGGTTRGSVPRHRKRQHRPAVSAAATTTSTTTAVTTQAAVTTTATAAQTIAPQVHHKHVAVKKKTQKPVVSAAAVPSAPTTTAKAAAPPHTALTLSSASATGFTVVNHGKAAAGAFAVLLSDGTSYSFAPLAAGVSVSRSFVCSAISRTAAISPASDADGGQSTFSIPPCAPAPSLVFSSTSATGFTLENSGNAVAPAFSVALSDGSSYSFSALAAGASISQSFTCAASQRTATISPATDAAAGNDSIQIPACPPPPAAATLTLSCARAGGPVGGSFQFTGSLTPAVQGSSVTITYTPPRGAAATDTVTTADSSYTDTFSPQTAGTWTAEAKWAGDATRQAATSPTCTFNVG